jgi:hypothetical protein
METVGLTDAVMALRNELTSARELGQGQDVLFEVGPVDVEFSVVISRTGGGKAGLTIGVVTLGGEASIGRDETHRIKVTLTPKDSHTGEAPEINDTVTELPAR